MFTIPVIVRNIDEKTSRIVAVAENLNRSDMTLMETCEAVGGLSEMFSQDEIGQKLGKPKSWVSKVIAISNGEEELKKFVTKGYTGDIEAIYRLKILYKQNKFR